MPSFAQCLYILLPIVLTAWLDQVYRGGNAFGEIAVRISSGLFGGAEPSILHCYDSITTLSAGTPGAKCFTVLDGKFQKIIGGAVSGEVHVGHVIPGLWDGHGHLLQFGESLDSVDLFGTQSISEVKARLTKYKNTHPEAGSSTQWLRGIGWDQGNLEGGKFPVSDDLEIDEEFSKLYIMLDRVDVHCIWVSNQVLALLPSTLPNVPGGEIPAKGVFCDNAMDLVLEYYPKPDVGRKTAFVKDAMRELNKLGIVGMHDAGVVPSNLDLYSKLSQDDDWSVRVYAMIECDVRNTFCPTDVKRLSTPNGKYHVQGVKLFGDGALGSWGSAMILPYSDKPTSSGSLLVNATTLSKITLEWATAGYQVNIHAIGDLANRHTIDAFENAFRSLCPHATPRDCQAKHRFRIEHSQIIHLDDQRRMLDFGIIPSIQPTHATSDMSYAESRLGSIRTKEEAYRMRSLLPLHPILGSDFPVEPANIFEGIYAATTRRHPRTGLDADGGMRGWYPEETLTLEEALRGFTQNPAYGAFLEGKAGVIEAGAYADWVVLDEPLEELDPEAVRKLSVKETWVGGKRVYQRP
ncbi:hypothetical protein ACN47E_004954 [Coniothyrium glycines]